MTVEEHSTGVPQEVIDLILSCLTAAGFTDIKMNLQKERYVFNDGEKTSEIEFSRSFLDDSAKLLPNLKHLLTVRIIPSLKDTPGKKIMVGSTAFTTVERE